MIHTTQNQCTIAGPATVEGFGYWGGRDVRVEFRPGKVDGGIVFVRRDLDGCPRVAARVSNRIKTPLRTTLRTEDAGVDMIEHVMAALAGLGIDNCEIWTNEPEMPGCDGSCEPFVDALDAIGIVTQDAPRPQRVVREIIRLGDQRSWVEAAPPLANETVLKYQLDYGAETAIGRQAFQLTLTPESFRRELATSRTFLLKSEADWLLSQGLGQRVTCRDVLVFAEDGPIGNQLRFADECVRHKLLDMVGDLALAGCRLVGRFTAHRSGHRLNAELVRTLLAETEVVTHPKQCA